MDFNLLLEAFGTVMLNPMNFFFVFIETVTKMTIDLKLSLTFRMFTNQVFVRAAFRQALTTKEEK